MCCVIFLGLHHVSDCVTRLWRDGRAWAWKVGIVGWSVVNGLREWKWMGGVVELEGVQIARIYLIA